MNSLPDPAPSRSKPHPVRPLSSRTLPPKRDFAAEEEAGRRLTNAHIQLRRGMTTEAEVAVLEILSGRPQDAGALELLGDIQATRGDFGSACASYQAALQAQPGRASAETKFGRATLRMAERQRLEKIGVAYAAADTSLVRGGDGADGRRNAWWGALGSAFCPGLGQIVGGQVVKGSILVGIFVLGLGLLALLPHAVGGRAGASYFSPVFWLVAALLAGDWLYAVADAALSSARTEAAPSEKDGWHV